MYNKHREIQFETYNKARKYFVDNYQTIIRLEQYLSNEVWQILNNNIREIECDYNEASSLFPFWQRYPPDDRGRQPKGDQYPWIEVGEKTIGSKLDRLLGNTFEIRDIGLPSGPDERYVIKSNFISRLSNNATKYCWLFIDIKSVGPRDDADHTVMSHNQITGNGIWNDINEGVVNDVIIARGKRTNHPFYCAMPPIYVTSNGYILPVITMVIKPVYSMLSLERYNDGGQPLRKITQVTIPNGLLLFEGPQYLNKYPNLFFPGKDDKSKNPLKMRARISFRDLRSIDKWRVKTLYLN